MNHKDEFGKIVVMPNGEEYEVIGWSPEAPVFKQELPYFILKGPNECYIRVPEVEYYRNAKEVQRG